MSGGAKDVTLSLKVMINKEKTKVLFAEANSDFVDILLSFLTMPLGRIVKVLEKHYGDKALVVGSLTTLHNGLANLDNVHFSSESAKLMLLNPSNSLNSDCRKLILDISDSQPIRYFTCGKLSCGCKGMYYGTATCYCGRKMDKEVRISDSRSARADADADGGVFTRNTTSFIVGDDVQVVPNVRGILHTLNNLGITDMVGAEIRNVAFGYNEIMDLFKASLFSSTPLSDLVLNNRQADYSATKHDPGFLWHQIDQKEESVDPKKIILKVMVQKSTKKLLFAQADDDFVELLFTFLIIPIGGVEYLLGSNTSLKNIDNFYRSVANVIDDKYFASPDTKKRLMNPKLASFYKSENTFLPLSEESCSFRSPKGKGNYVKEPTTYMVTDDLIVTPFCMTTSLTILNRLNIPLSDADELEVHIGLEEALSILKASLSSTSALTNGLINHITKKQAKQER